MLYKLMKAEDEGTILPLDWFELLPKEKIIDVKGYEELYQVTNYGRIWGIKRQNWLIAGIDNYGYEIVSLCKNGIKRTRTVHQIVLENFDRPKKSWEVCRHLDNNKLNNYYPVNIKWGTQEENIQDGIKAGTINVIGSDNGNSFLNDDEVLQIRAKYSTGDYTQRQLAREYKVSQRLIWNIVNREFWTHI